VKFRRSSAERFWQNDDLEHAQRPLYSDCRRDHPGWTVITGQKPHSITARGMARTFQNIRLFGELNVLDNVLIGQHSHSKAGLVSSIFQPPSQKVEEKQDAGRRPWRC